jgi:FtsH-binding integral membrane protein
MKQKKIKEHYNDNGVTNYLSFIWNKFTITLWAIVGFAAIWYSFVIRGGLHWDIILAFLFAPIYLIWGIYKVGIPPKKD